MAKISNTLSYPNQSPIEGADYLIGTAANSSPIDKQTKTFTIQGIADFVIDQAFDGVSYRLPVFTGSTSGVESVKLVNSLIYQDTATDGTNPTSVGGTTVYIDDGNGVGSLQIAENLTVGSNSMLIGDLNVNGKTALLGDILLLGPVYDANNQVGNNEQVLVSDASGNVTWQNYQGSGLEFQGTWNADTNTPDLQAISLIPGNTGKYWVVSVAGTTDLSGITDWEPQDWAIISEDDAGNVFWAKIDNSPVITGSGMGDSLVTQDADPITNPLVTVNGNIIIGSNQLSLTSIKSNDNFEPAAGETTASQIILNGQNNSLAAGYFLSTWKGDTTTVDSLTGRKLIQDMPNGIFNFDARIDPITATNTGGTYAKLFQLTEGYANHKFSITQDGGDTAQGNRGPSFNLGGVAYANGQNAVAMGAATTAFGNGSLAANFLTLASGGGASAFGLSTEASALASAAFGNKTLASGAYSISSGQDTIASGQSSVAIGEKGEASGKNTFVSGFGGTATANNAVKFGFDGTASAPNSVALGFQSTAGADGSVAAGYQNTISPGADYSFASGKTNTISGVHSAVFGNNNNIDRTNSLAFGNNNAVTGNSSIVGGASNTIYTGSNSAIFGSINKINATTSFVAGKNNFVNTGADFSALFGENNIATGGERAFATGIGNQVLDKNTFATGANHEVLAENAFAAGSGNISTAFQSAAFGFSTEARGNNSFTFGENSIASGINSFAGGKLTNASAERAVALGNSTTSSGPNAFSIGFGSSSTAANSASFGQNNAASGLQSFATGNNNAVSGNNASAFGQNHTVSGNQGFTAGGSNQIIGTTGIALGASNNINSSGSIAIGSAITVSNANGIAIGKDIVLDDSSPTFAFGWQLRDATSVQGQVVIGQYNAPSPAKVIIGAGGIAAGLNAIEAYTSHIALGAYGNGNVSPDNSTHYNLKVDSTGKVFEDTASSFYTYTALISQTGTSAPTESVLANSLKNAGTLTWSRNSGGDYSLTSTSTPFTSGKTIVFVNGGSAENNHDIAWNRISDSEIKILTHNSDDKLNNGSLEIRVYQ
ncbi:MAG: hypothetical protein ACXABD_10525 [Candidatus Thorarchaeota archaeon]|jgi:hypothetical protein